MLSKLPGLDAQIVCFVIRAAAHFAEWMHYGHCEDYPV
jgi:hypothetical protein